MGWERIRYGWGWGGKGWDGWHKRRWVYIFGVIGGIANQTKTW